MHEAKDNANWLRKPDYLFIMGLLRRWTRGLSGGFTDMLGRYAKLHLLYSFLLKANSPKANRASRLNGARSVAAFVSLYIGISLFTGISLADSAPIKIIDPKTYIRFNYDDKSALCLIKLYGKESAFNPRAIGNLSGAKQVYGIPQLKNPIIQHLSAIEQIDYGMKYIAHRYNGLPCRAWAHWLDKGWH
jgi:hypothetical protein